MIQIREHVWVNADDIVAVVEDYDHRYAPPQFRHTTITLRGGTSHTVPTRAGAVLAAMDRATTPLYVDRSAVDNPYLRSTAEDMEGEAQQ